MQRGERGLGVEVAADLRCLDRAVLVPQRCPALNPFRAQFPKLVWATSGPATCAARRAPF
jgi:hypothetical protein